MSLVVRPSVFELCKYVVRAHFSDMAGNRVMQVRRSTWRAAFQSKASKTARASRRRDPRRRVDGDLRAALVLSGVLFWSLEYPGCQGWKAWVEAVPKAQERAHTESIFCEAERSGILVGRGTAFPASNAMNVISKWGTKKLGRADIRALNPPPMFLEASPKTFNSQWLVPPSHAQHYEFST